MLAANSQNKHIKCESKRDFYVNESDVPPEVGSPTEPQLPGLVKEEMSAESFFEQKIKLAREQLQTVLEKSKQVYIEQSDKYFKSEREVSSTISGLHDKTEELFPNALYVITGGLFGSIIARKKNFLFRIISPTVFGLASFNYFFPSTFNNVFGFLDNAEKTSLPDVYAKQTEIINQAEELVKKTQETAENSTKEVTGYFSKMKKSIGYWTGMNVDQTVSDKKE